jgi:hypothetical protein
MLGLLKDFICGLVELSISLTEFFLQRIIVGLEINAFWREEWKKGVTSYMHYCAKLCLKTNLPYNSCLATKFGNETDTFPECKEMIANAVSTALLESHDNVAKYRYVFHVIVFLILLFASVCMVLWLMSQITQGFKGLVSVIFTAWRSARSPREIRDLEDCIRKAEMEMKLAHLKRITKTAEQFGTLTESGAIQFVAEMKEAVLTVKDKETDNEIVSDSVTDNGDSDKDARKRNSRSSIKK